MFQLLKKSEFFRNCIKSLMQNKNIELREIISYI